MKKFRFRLRAVYGFGAIAVCVVILCWWFSVSRARDSTSSRTNTSASESEIDAALVRAASTALGEREGTILVMEAQTGRLRAVVNPHLAFEQAFPPGSTIKPFTALTALRAGLINDESRLLCRERYTHANFEIACAHPPHLAPFDMKHALAYSCNYYFGELGERLNESDLDTALASFGFGAKTGAEAVDIHESSGRLERTLWQPESALGEGRHLLVTPAQLLMAYTALVNGGHLYSTLLSTAASYVPHERASLDISPAHRAVLIDGMRGAVEYGTAERAHLDALPFYVFGKTGTATEIKGFRTHGWFVGFAAETDEQGSVPPAKIELAVLVFLKRAHGAECALVARSIFEEYAKQQAAGSRQWAVNTVGEEKQRFAFNCLLPTANCQLPSQVRVHLVSDDKTETVSLEEYILGVVAAEGSTEDELEALKALAVASRTYALRNRGRHASEGYDFCNKTHCQRYIHTPVDSASVRGMVQRALNETAGEVLQDERGEIADAYFHAACGGMTANVQTLWGTRAPDYLRGVRDDYCATGAHRSWTDVIPVEELLTALRSDSRSDVGERLKDIKVVRRDATGRAEFLMLEGERRRTLRGWDFKMIVGRALGWNVLKSSRFEVSRAGRNFIFRGSGFGHGLGLCQEGAHVMAERGASYRQILKYYFPGTSVARN